MHDTNGSLTPRAVLLQWLDAFNRADAHALARLYHVDAVNHQAPNDPVEGRENIQAMFLEEFDHATMQCIVEHVHEAGEWIIMEWKDPKGLIGCGFFHIVDGKIRVQRGYWDKHSFLRLHERPFPKQPPEH